MDCVEGVCTHVGCTSDAQCTPEVICEDQPEGTCEPRVCVTYSEAELPGCVSRCQTPEDCALNAQRELGLDGPDPNDPWTHVDIFTCRQGFCHVKTLGCSVDADCALIGHSGPCWLP